MSIARASLSDSFATPNTRRTKVATGSLTRRSTATNSGFPGRTDATERLRAARVRAHPFRRIDLNQTREALFT